MIFAVVLLSTAVLVYGYRWVALRRHWVDVPNMRSSHRELVPRGAGVVFVLTILGGLIFIFGWSGEKKFVASILVGIGVAAAGWWDDLRGLSARIRLIVYGVICAIAVLFVFYREPVGMIQISTILLVAIALLWWLNLYNFMDGINGIAALQGIFLVAAALLLSSHISDAEDFFYIVILAALGGFLCWNFPRAFVFMGDAGSSFLGFLLGVLALWSISAGAMSLWQWLILAGVFIVDASYTLSVRVMTGQRWREAHRSHMYQRLTDLCGSHVWAVFWLMAINVLWLFPMAHFSRVASNSVFAINIAAYAPIVFLCLFLKAGRS